MAGSQPQPTQSSSAFPSVVFLKTNTIVSALVTKDEVQAAEIEELVEKKFEGSLPAFVAAFTKHQRFSKEEIDEVQAMIDRFRGGE